MGPERLEISRLSSTGEVVRKITCLAGRVTVFRANSEAEFDLYRSALAGWKTSERFSILLDGKSFSPSKHAFLGFGESYVSERGNDSIKKILLECGISESNIEAALLEFGLGGLAEAPCKALSPAQERLVRILACTAKNDHIVALYEPFEVLPEMWREKAAEMLARFAWEKKALVVVVKLTTRPECWIENEHIARVQLERPRKRTIGFGADSSDTSMFVAQVRKDSAAFDLNLLRQQGAAGIVPAFSQMLLAPRTLAYGCIVLIIAAASIAYWVAQAPQRINITRGLDAGPEFATQPADASSVAASLPNNNSDGTDQVSVQEKVTSTRAVLAIDSYSPELKEAITLAFSNPAEVLEKQRVSYPKQPSAPAVSKIHIEAASDSSLTVDPMLEGSLDEMSLEARREEIRRRFLAAIQANQ